jgi:hypothetical protein
MAQLTTACAGWVGCVTEEWDCWDDHVNGDGDGEWDGREGCRRSGKVRAGAEEQVDGDAVGEVGGE